MNTPAPSPDAELVESLRSLAERYCDTMSLTREGAIRRVERLHDALLDAIDRIEALSAASPTAVVEEGWQPIETAPKDDPETPGRGPLILLCDIESEPDVAIYEVGNWVEQWGKRGHGGWRSESNRFPSSPTHWRPLPEPPLPITKAGERDQ